MRIVHLMVLSVCGLVLAVGTAEARGKTYKWYGSWAESVGQGSRSSGSVSYMSNMELKLDGKRATMKHSFNSDPVARISGTITSRRKAAGKETIEVTFRPRRLAKTFATSTGSLVDGHLRNAYHLPGGDVSLGTASAELKARFVISDGGHGVKVRWRGIVDKYKPNVTAHGWQHGLRGKAANLMKDFIKQRSRPLRISGSFSSLSAR